MRRFFKEELKNLRKRVVEVFDVVILQIEEMLALLLNYDEERLNAMLRRDDEIDSRVLSIEEDGIQLVATQCPVATDLRLIHSVLLINVHLERMGDLVYNTGKALKRLAELGEADRTVVEELHAMGEKVLDIVRKTREAFETQSVEIAEELRQMDEAVDSYFKSFLRKMSKFTEQEHTLEWYLSIILISRYFERLADQSVDIGERVLFTITGHYHNDR